MSGPRPEFAGRIYSAGEAVTVSATKVREFARATGNDHPLHLDTDAATHAGYPAIVAPPTFLVTLAQAEEARYINDPEAGVDFSRVVHAEESFALERPIVAGDVLIPTLQVESVKSVGPHSMVSTRVDFATVDGTHVAAVRSSLIIRGEETR